MENKRILPFAFGDNLVRVLEDEPGNPWWVAKDVCDILGLANSRKAVSELDEDEKITVTNGDGNPRAGIPHQYTLISESGLYSLIFRSRKPEAKAFSKWVRSEVLPTIRKTGSYERKRHTGCIPGRAALPDELPPEALTLRPGMRQKLWENALQTARLDGGDSASALDIFVWLCRMVAEQPPAPPTGYDEVRAFFFQCCSHAAGHREAQRIYMTPSGSGIGITKAISQAARFSGCACRNLWSARAAMEHFIIICC